MSATLLKLIPVNPEYVPKKIFQEYGKLYLNKIFSNEEIIFSTTNNVNFVDQGENFDTVSCNLCKQIIEIAFWQTKMDKSYERHFTDLTFITECCYELTSLNDLVYDYPAGFSCFIISIRNPIIEITERQIVNLENLLGTKLRLIWAHY